MVTLAVVLFVLAVVVAGVGAAGLSGRLPRNSWAGVRTPATMRDDEAFALANRVAAPTTLAAAGLFVIGGGAALALDTGLALAAIVACLLVAVVTAGAGGAVGARAAAGGLQAAAAAGTAQAAAAGVDCAKSCASCTLKDGCQPS